MRGWLMLGGLLTATACTIPTVQKQTLVTLRVDSEPPGAAIIVNKRALGAAPVAVEMACPIHWVGYLRSKDGWREGGKGYHAGIYRISAQVPVPGGVRHQSMTVAACDLKDLNEPSITFDLSTHAIQATRNPADEPVFVAPAAPPRRYAPELERALKRLDRDLAEGRITQRQYEDRRFSLLRVYLRE